MTRAVTLLRSGLLVLTLVELCGVTVPTRDSPAADPSGTLSLTLSYAMMPYALDLGFSAIFAADLFWHRLQRPFTAAQSAACTWNLPNYSFDRLQGHVDPLHPT